MYGKIEMSSENHVTHLSMVKIQLTWITIFWSSKIRIKSKRKEIEKSKLIAKVFRAQQIPDVVSRRQKKSKYNKACRQLAESAQHLFENLIWNSARLLPRTPLYSSSCKERWKKGIKKQYLAASILYFITF